MKHLGLLLIGLIVLKSIKLNRKKVVLEYLILYSLLRFGVEIFRGDTVRGYVGDLLSTSQVISVIILTISVFLFIKKENEVK
jgi:phosphatidylglycerol:prolipoprotein diacylglycerol transferase